MTETLSCDLAPARAPVETEFEKQRGVSAVEVRRGFAQVYVAGLTAPVMTGRLRALKAVADVGVSLDFLKLSPAGLSFLVADDRAETVRDALRSAGVEVEVQRGRSIVLVHAVNIRDEEGLLADIVRQVIERGVTVDHVGDMHDRLLLVLEAAAAEAVAAGLKTRLL